MSFTDSIMALSSGRLPAGIAVIRISGPQTRFALETILGYVPPVRSMKHASLHRSDGSVLDRGLTVFFEAPDSFTGEDVAEFHLHGGRAVVAAVLDELRSIGGIRHAEAGEFTRRAFLNGKMDLVQTEALADLIQAETEAQRRFALQNAGDARSHLYEAWRSRLIRARALLEAELDFADEADVPGSVSGQVWKDVETLAVEVSRQIDGYGRAEIIRDGFDVAIVGAPNAGKSSLLNALARREAAIVSDEPGTTRDPVEVAMDIGGIKVVLTDTAGLRDDAGKVEAIGIQRALARAKAASLVLYVEDMARPVRTEPPVPSDRLLRIGSKLDIVDNISASRYNFAISAQTGAGISELLGEIGRRAADAVGDLGDILPSRARHQELLERTCRHLAQALAMQDHGIELRAEELRLASDALGRITGTVDVEDLLDVIFSEFCIGK